MSYTRIATFHCKPGRTQDIVRMVEGSFIELFRQQAGFLSFVLTPMPDDTLMSVSLWRTKADAETATRVAAGWVAVNAQDAIVSADVRLAETGVVDNGSAGPALLVETMYAAFNDHALDRLPRLLAPGARTTNMTSGEDAPMVDYLQIWMTAFPDASIDLQRMVATADAVMTEFIGRGTHTGVMQTPDGPIAPTGRKVEIPFVDCFDVRDGKIVRGRNYFDVAGFMRQLGIVQPTPSPKPTREAPSPAPRH